MNLKRILFRSLLFGTLFFSPIDIIVKNKEITKIFKVHTITSLDFQRMKGFSHWYKENDDYDLINSFVQEHKIPTNSKIITIEEDTLLNMIRRHSRIRFSFDEYRSKIYPEFVRMNEAFQKRKAGLESYDLLKFDEQYYLVKNDTAVKLNDDISEIIKKNKDYIENLEDFRRKYSKENYYNVVSTTLLNLSEFLPFIKKFNVSLDEESILGLISSESLGYQLVGGSGDIGLFQLYPKTIRKIYDELRHNKSKIDSSYEHLSKIDSMNFESFNSLVAENQFCNIEAGFYWLKRLESIAENKAHLILLYHIGQSNFSLLPKKIKNRIIDGEINDYKDIRDNEMKYKGMHYLYYYFAKKEYFAALRDIYAANDSI